jgi:hypothetical protein
MSTHHTALDIIHAQRCSNHSIDWLKAVAHVRYWRMLTVNNPELLRTSLPPIVTKLVGTSATKSPA